MRFAWSSPTEVALGIMSLDGWCPERSIVLLLVDGAELSSSACVDGEDGRRLLAGEAFRPDLAVYDAGATKTLPGYLVQEAVVEGLLRLSAVLSGELADHRLEDHLALSLTERIVQLGDEIAARRAAGPVSADTRLELAELNGLTHMALLSFRRSRYSGKAWYVATEISSVIGARRTQAIAPLLPAVFEQMMRGREAWGSRTAPVLVSRLCCYERERERCTEPGVRAAYGAMVCGDSATDESRGGRARRASFHASMGRRPSDAVRAHVR